eukprot:Skav235571  [mRNA]  locus=scaffold612:37277:37642:+ [translate_table: standard]
MEKYTHGHHKSVVSVHNARTVEDSAAFLLPMLQGHFKLLDVGCGPGSITRGFTKHVKEVVGVDNSEDVIAEARASGDGVDFQVARVLVAKLWHRFFQTHFIPNLYGSEFIDCPRGTQKPGS